MNALAPLTRIVILFFVLAAGLTTAARYMPVALPAAEAGQPRTRCVSMAGADAPLLGMRSGGPALEPSLYFTRYWADVLPGTNCAFYMIPYGVTNAINWIAMAPAPKYVQEPPSWFETNLMQTWAGNGMSYGEANGTRYLFMFGSIAKGGTGEDIGRDLLGYSIDSNQWQIVTNRYDSGGTDAACTFVASNSIYGFWTGWTPMQRWTWDKNSLGIVQQTTVGSAALHPIAGTRVGNLGVFVVFQSGLASARLMANTAGTIDNVTLSTTLPWNVGMGCAIQRVPAASTLSGLDELWILRGGSGDNSGDGLANNTPNADVLVLAFTNTATSIAIVGQRQIRLPFLTGGEGSDMACVSNLMYFLRYNGAINPELYAIATTYQAQDPPTTPWPLNGNNKQRQGWYTNGWVMTGGKIMWTNQTQTGVGIYGSGVTDGQRFYLPVDPAPGNNNKELLAIDVNGGTNVWAIDLMDWANGTPALSQDRVYIGDNASYVYAINKLTGAIIWSNNLGAGSCNGGVLLNNDRVYIESDGNAGGTFCLNADSGAVLWHNNAPTNAGTWSGNGPSLSPDGAAVYVHTEGDLGGQIFAMDALTGSTLWYRVYASGWGGQEPIVDNAGNIYCNFDGVATPAGNDVLISFKPNGTTNWIFDLGMHDAWHHGGYALSPDGATIYCSRRSGGGATGIGLTAVNTATGIKKWDAACGDTGGGCVVGAGNLILGVFQTATGRAVKAIQDNGASGDVLWSTQIASTGDTWTWPTLLPNGDVIAMTEYVIAHITLPTPAPPIGWCNLQWPYTLTVVNTNGPGVSDKVYGQIWINNVTLQPGPTPGLKAWLGYGPSNALPNALSWQWTPADFNVQVGDNDEFYTNFVIAQAVPAGVYAYCYYYEYQTNDVPSTGYGQKDGGPRTLATYNPAQSGLLTVVPEPALLAGLLTGLALWLRKR
ncbi:MAG: PQQ-binding-like beta-propeller repeat protein [bacterium]|nr:PQQ-binding-like beta-propeller repeat protein [bacterium]